MKTEYIKTLAQEAKQASYLIAKADTKQKNRALLFTAELLLQNKQAILAANSEDLKLAKENNLDDALLDRLALTEDTIAAMVLGLQQIVNLQDPVGEMNDFYLRPSGIQIGKMRVPLGVIGIIYESRPNVTVDAAGLCIKSGNACILRGGKEALNTNKIIAKLVQEGLILAGLPKEVLRFVEQIDRAIVGEMLKLVDLIDVIIPRGGKSLVKRISEEARIPVIKHLDGICHVYIDEYADLTKAINIAVNAKTSRYGTCNTMETLLVNQIVASQVLPELARVFTEKNVELRGCEKTKLILTTGLKLAIEQDWQTEYLAPILSIKIVKNIDEAIEHINHYGSHHTDSIVSEHYSHIQKFIREVDSSSVMANASTRFADGFEYGLGAEIGISTDKIHARGPVGLEGLTSQKWVVFGSGQIRD